MAGKTLESRGAHWYVPVAATGLGVLGMAVAGAGLLTGYDWATHLNENFDVLNDELANAATAAERKEELSSWMYYVEGLNPHMDQLQVTSLKENTTDKLAAISTLGGLVGLVFMGGRASRGR